MSEVGKICTEYENAKLQPYSGLYQLYSEQAIPSLPQKHAETLGLSNVDRQATHILLEYLPKRDEEGFPPVSGCLTI
jgi:hypothetical protein